MEWGEGALAKLIWPYHTHKHTQSMIMVIDHDHHSYGNHYGCQQGLAFHNDAGKMFSKQPGSVGRRIHTDTTCAIPLDVWKGSPTQTSLWTFLLPKRSVAQRKSARFDRTVNDLYMVILVQRIKCKQVPSIGKHINEQVCSSSRAQQKAITPALERVQGSVHQPKTSALSDSYSPSIVSSNLFHHNITRFISGDAVLISYFHKFPRSVPKGDTRFSR